MNKDYIEKNYQVLKNLGINVGSLNDFRVSMRDPKYVDGIYDILSKQNGFKRGYNDYVGLVSKSLLDYDNNNTKKKNISNTTLDKANLGSGLANGSLGQSNENNGQRDIFGLPKITLPNNQYISGGVVYSDNNQPNNQTHNKSNLTNQQPSLNSILGKDSNYPLPKDITEILPKYTHNIDLYEDYIKKTKVTDEQLDRIKKSVDDEEADDSWWTKTKNVISEHDFFSREKGLIQEYKNYETLKKEKEQAREELIEENKLLKAQKKPLIELNKENITVRAKEIKIQQQIKKQEDYNKQQYLDGISKEQRENILKYAKDRSNLLAKKNVDSKDFENLKNNVSADEFNLQNKIAFLKENAVRFHSRLNENVKIGKVSKEHANKLYQNYIIQETKKIDELVKDLDNKKSELYDMAELSDLNQNIDLLKRDYNDVKKFFTSLGHSAGTLAMNLFGGLGSMVGDASYDAVNYAEEKTGLNLGSKHIDDNRKILNTAKDLVDKKILNPLQDNYKKTKSLDDVNSFSDFVEFAMSGVIANTLPSVAVASTGVGGVLALGGSGAGGKYQEIKELEKETGKEIGWLDKTSSSVGAGVLETIDAIVTRSASLKQVKRLAKVDDKPLQDLLGRSMIKTLTKEGGTYVRNVISEGTSELTTQLGNNLIDIHILEKHGVNVWDGAKDAFVSGALMSGMLGTPTVITKGVIQPFIVDSKYKKLTNQLDSLYEKYDNVQSEDEANVIKTAIDNTVLEIRKISTDVAINVKNLTDKEFERVVNIESKQKKLRKESESVLYNENYDDDTKNIIRKQKKEEFENLENERKEILSEAEKRAENERVNIDEIIKNLSPENREEYRKIALELLKNQIGDNLNNVDQNKLEVAVNKIIEDIITVEQKQNNISNTESEVVENQENISLSENNKVETKQENNIVQENIIERKDVLQDENNNQQSTIENNDVLDVENNNVSDNTGIDAKMSEIKENTTETTSKDINVVRMPIENIQTDESRFQGRKKLNESVIKNIAENFSDKDQDPIHIWQDPKDGKTYVLSGHHRYYGAKMAGRNDVKVIDRSADFTEEQAIKFAKEEANANRSMETPLERANTLRDKRNRGDADIKEFLAKEGKNGRYVENLSYLNPKGKVMNMLNQLSETDDRATIKEMERIADWVGEVMKRFDGVLTKAHEDELYDFLMGEKSKRFTNKADFAENVRAIIDKLFFDNNQPLNLNRISNKGDGMRMWEEERDRLKGELKAVTEKKTTKNTKLSKEESNAEIENEAVNISNDNPTKLNVFINGIHRENIPAKNIQDVFDKKISEKLYIEKGFVNTNEFDFKPPKTKKGIEGLGKIVSKDTLRPSLKGVFIEENFYVATDAHKLVIIERNKKDGLETGKIYDVKGKYSDYLKTLVNIDDAISEKEWNENKRYIDSKYPDYKAVFPKQYKFKTPFVAVKPILKHAYIAGKLLKSHSTKNKPIMPLKIGEIEIYTDANLLFETLQSLSANGTKHISIEVADNKKLVIKSKENKNQAVIMASFIPTTSNANVQELFVKVNELHIKATENKNFSEEGSETPQHQIAPELRTTPQRQRISDNTFWKFINKAKRFARGYFGDVKIFTDWNEFKTHANKLNGKDKVKQQKAQDTESLRLEKERIVSEAKANGTYMKAPNGQPTNLNEEQWVAVRTKAFKDWFGDWELGAKEVQIAQAKPHNFKNFAEAKAWAKENIVKIYTDEETAGKGEINISNNSIAKYLSESSVERSDNKDVHLSVLKVLPQIIKNGIVAEQHADYNKNKQGARNIDSGINENVNIQRVFGAVNLEGRIYRVKVTLKEYKDKNTSKKPHSYEATKIELLAGTLVDTNSTNPNTNNSITGTNLLKGVEKSYEKGKFLLDHSKVVDQNGEPLVVYHGTNNYETTKKWNDKTKSYDNTHKEITVFKRDIDGLKNNGIFFNSDADNAYGYGSVGYEVFLNLTNPLIIEANGDHFSEVRHKGEEKDTYEWAEYAEKNKYDGVIFNNIRDGVDFQDLETPTDDYVAFHPNQIKSATDNIGTYSEDSNDIRYHIGDKARQTYEQQIRKKNPNISEEHLQEALDFLHSLEDNKQNTKAIKVAVKWLETDAIRLPFAMDNVRKAIALAEKHKIDPMQFKSPMDIINKYYVDVEYGKEINPDKIPQFTNKRIIGEGENEVVVYDVEDSQAGQRAVTKICHQHFGYSNSQKGSKQPWCLASFTRKGEPTESAERYWFNTYDSVGKKIAFQWREVEIKEDNTKKEISEIEFNRSLMEIFNDSKKARSISIKLKNDGAFYFTEMREGVDYFVPTDNFKEVLNSLEISDADKVAISNIVFTTNQKMEKAGLVPIAFMAHDKSYEGDLWWDLNDSPSNNLPLPNGDYLDPDGSISNKKGGNEDDDLDQYYEDAVENVIDNMGNFSWREILQWNYGKVVYEGSRKMQTSGIFEDTESDIYERTNDLLKEEIERKINNGDFYSELEDKIEEYREYHEYAEDEELDESELDDIKQELADEIFENYYKYDGLEDLRYELEETAFEEELYYYNYTDYQKRMILEDYMAYSDNGYEYQEEVREEQERLWQEDGGGYTDLKFQIENDKTNAQFNNELRQMINGSLPSGHIFQLGRPNALLQSAGIPNLPIEMSSARLKTKAMQENHLFDLSEVENLPQAIQNPIGIFAYGDKSKSVNIITELQDKNGKKYLVGIHFNQDRRGLVVNDIRGIFPKDNAEWLNWISQGKGLYLDKKKVQDLITQQQTNLAEVSYIDLNSVTKVLKNFQNPKQNNNLQELRTPSGVVYGAKLSDGSLYFNPDKLNYDTAIHELSHLWEQMFPKEWNEGVELFKKTKQGKEIFKQLKNEGNYNQLSDEQLWSEAMNTFIGKYGEQKMLSRDSAFKKFAEWLKNMIEQIGHRFGIKDLSIDSKFGQFADKVVKDITSGKELKMNETKNSREYKDVERMLDDNFIDVISRFAIKKEC